MNETINDVLRKDYDSCVKDLKKSEKKREKLEKENQRLNNVLNELEKLTISICENCYEDKETEKIKKRINELKESNNGQ